MGHLGSRELESPPTQLLRPTEAPGIGKQIGKGRGGRQVQPCFATQPARPRKARLRPGSAVSSSRHRRAWLSRHAMRVALPSPCLHALPFIATTTLVSSRLRFHFSESTSWRGRGACEGACGVQAGSAIAPGPPGLLGRLRVLRVPHSSAILLSSRQLSPHGRGTHRQTRPAEPQALHAAVGLNLPKRNFYKTKLQAKFYLVLAQK